MKGCEFVLDYFHLLHFKCHKIYPNHGGSYIDSPDWIKNKKAAINPIKIINAFNMQRSVKNNIYCLCFKT